MKPAKGALGVLMLGTLILVIALTAACTAKVAVPNVVGKASAEATSALTAAKLKVAGTQDYSETIAEGLVVSQNPAAGAEAPEGSDVTVVVSKGKHPVAVPDVSGLDSTAAGAAMNAAGLSMLTYDEYDAATPKGKAFEQLPAAGTDTRAGSSAIVGFSLGAPPTNQDVPTVLGKSTSSAVAALKAGGFKVSLHTQHVVGAKPGTVISQVPGGGAKAAPGSHVIILTSSGSPSAPVPNVDGMKRQKATSALDAAGFNPQAFEMVNGKVARGVVFAQVPASGSSQLYGSEAIFAVSLGDPGEAVPLQAPDVANMTESAANAALTSAGFVPYVVRGHDPRVAKGQVSMQVPAAGAYALKGQQVVIMVSQGPLSNAVVSVPSVIGKSKSAATAALASAGCLADVSRLFSPTVPKGAVMGQLPKAGAKVAVNSDVVTVVSLGKPPAQGIVVPNVTGMVEEKAVTQLQDLGLVTVSLSGPPSTYPIGSIMAQFPKAGTKVKAGAQVVLAIAP